MNSKLIVLPASLLLAVATAPHATIAAPIGSSARAAAAEDILAKSRAMYATLRSYADSGTVVVEYGSPDALLKEQHTFRTYFRRPRSFYFDFTKQKQTSRFVVWSDANAFHSWWQTTGVQQDFPKGSGTGAFTAGVVQTNGSLPQVASFLWPDARLVSALTEFGDATEVGTEAVDGRPCHKLVGIAKSTYGQTGREVNVRRATVWIDVETLLVRKVFEDTPRGSPRSSVSRTTTTFRPHANPNLDGSVFQFAPPMTQE